MRPRPGFRSLGALLLPFLLIVCLLAGGLAWLGWRVLEQDRTLENQRLLQRLGAGADAVGTLLLRDLVEAEDMLGQLDPTSPASGPAWAPWLGASPRCDALVVVFRRAQVEAFPRQCLRYYPSAPADEGTGAVFDRGETLEYRQNNVPAALAFFREAARFRDPAVRAGALVRLARTQRKAGRDDEALATYAELASVTGVRLGDVPADLVARHARCALLEQLQRRDDLRREGASLRDDLGRGRWLLTRSTYLFHADDARRWADEKNADPAEEGALVASEATDRLWNEWVDAGGAGQALAGRRVAWIHDRPVLTVCRTRPDGVALFIATSAFLDREWVANAQPALARLNLQVALSDRDGRRVTGVAPGQAAFPVVRSSAESGLPWTLHVRSADVAADLAQSSARRRLVVAGLAMLIGLITVASYVIARAVAHELAVARMQSDFVSAVSHEFRTPLSSLRQLSELLADGRVPGEERRHEYYEDLRHESERLHRLVENLLDFGSMEAGARRYRLESLDVSQLVQDVAAEFGREAADRGYRVETAIGGPLPRIEGDREALVRALWNLLDNAVKYSPGVKTVWLEARGDASGVHLAVRDEGLGIAREEHGRIFEKFVRGASAHAAGIKGTGLGLAMVTHIARGHRGTVSVSSTSGVGSTFTMTLPAAKCE